MLAHIREIVKQRPPVNAVSYGYAMNPKAWRKREAVHDSGVAGLSIEDTPAVPIRRFTKRFAVERIRARAFRDRLIRTRVVLTGRCEVAGRRFVQCALP